MTRQNTLTNAPHEGFVKTQRASLEDVKLGRLNVAEFGLLTCLTLLINPTTGYWPGNFSLLAQELNCDEEEARYVCKKLLKSGRIYFDIHQGQRKKARFYVLGLEIKRGVIVSPNFILKSEKLSEVPKNFPKLSTFVALMRQSGYVEPTSPMSEVPYKEKETETETEQETESEKKKEREKSEEGEKVRFRKLTNSGTFDAFREVWGDAKFKQYLLSKNYDPSEVEAYFRKNPLTTKEEQP